MPDAGSLHADAVAALTQLYDHAREQEVGPYAKIIEAIQAAANAWDISDDDLAGHYDEGYVNGLLRAADIVQILAHGGKVGTAA